MSVFSSLWRLYGAGHMRSLLIMSVVSNALLLVPSFHMLQVYDRVLASGSVPTLVYLTLIALFMLLVYGVLEAVRGRIAQRLAARYTVIVSRKLFAKFSQMPQGTSQAAQYLRDYGIVRGFMGSRSFVSLFDLPYIPLFLILLFFVHWTVGLITLAAMIIMAGIAVANSVFSDPSRLEGQKADGEALGFAQATFTHEEDIRSLGLLPNFISIWGARTAGALKASEEAADLGNNYYALARTFRQSLQVFLMAWGAFLVVKGYMSGAMIFFVNTVTGKALGPIEQLTAGWDPISKWTAAYKNIEELTGENKSINTRPDLPAPKGFLRAENIVYKPENFSEPVLNNITFDIRPGEMVVVTGDAGAGKSALLRILSGALKPTSGVVRLDGAEMSLWPTGQWGRNIGYLAQEIQLFPGPIAANIARFDPKLDIQTVYTVAKITGAHDMILKIPGGYQAQVGSGRTYLTASQKHRIALARALYGGPRVLILDQPNANMDQNAEASLVSQLMAAKEHKVTVVVATQSPAIIRNCDRILIVRNGQVSVAQPPKFQNHGEGPPTLQGGMIGHGPGGTPLPPGAPPAGQGGGNPIPPGLSRIMPPGQQPDFRHGG